MDRAEMYRRLRRHPQPWDMIVIGGGATGAGIAIDAASRGYEILLLEQSDFGKGTSSRSTKLVHGGVRYLEQGNVSLVMEALRERGLLLRNAPHLVRDLGFVVPNYDWWKAPFYGLGLKLYDLLAGKYGFGASRVLSREETLRRLPSIETRALRGGVLYFDGQFDDSRLLIHMVMTASELGAALFNYFPVTGFIKDGDGYISGVAARDALSGEEFRFSARAVINAAGAFSDNVRSLEDESARPIMAPSRGAHLVLDRSFLPGESAILAPHTADGRVMFALPWHGHTLVGTTDIPVATVALEPVATDQEIDFILSTASRYLAKKPGRQDVLSVFAGIRPLVSSAGGGNTALLSRDHTVHIGKSGLVTIAGGKWTTYRRMAEDCVNQAAMLAQLPERECVTPGLPIHGFDTDSDRFGHLWVYGADAPAIQALARSGSGLAEPLHAALPYIAAEVIWAMRQEMAQTLEDILARRTRALFLNARAALEMAPAVADWMARERGRDAAWRSSQLRDFQATVKHYLVN